MKRSEAYPTKFLSKDDIHAPLVGVIDDVVNETLGQGDDQEIKPVMYFSSGIPKPMVINATNWMNVEGVYGDESDNWKGKRIEVWVDPSVSFGGKRIGGLRLRAPAPVSNGSKSAGAFANADEAVASVLAAGLTRDDLKAILPEKDGRRTFSPERDSAAVRALIAKNTPPEEHAMSETEMPF